MIEERHRGREHAEDDQEAHQTAAFDAGDAEPKTVMKRERETQLGFIGRFLDDTRTVGPGRFGVVADWGMGKTMLLRWIAHEIAERYLRAPARDAKLPLFIPLYRCSRGSIQKLDGLCQYASEAVRFDKHDLVSISQEKNRLIVLLDGLDESTSIAEDLKPALGDNGLLRDCTVIISTRPEALSGDLSNLENFSFQKGNRIEIEPFGPDDIRTYIRTYCDGPSVTQQTRDRLLRHLGVEKSLQDGGARLSEWINKPYLLNLYCQIATQDKDGVERLTEVDIIADLLLLALPVILKQRHKGLRDNGGTLLDEHWMWPLASLAFAIRLSRSTAWCERREDTWDGIDEGAAVASIGAVLDAMHQTKESQASTLSGKSPKEVLDAIVSSSGMVRITTDGNYTMNDARYADFLPAVHLARFVQGPWKIGERDENRGRYTYRINAIRTTNNAGQPIVCCWSTHAVIRDDIVAPSGHFTERCESVAEFISRKAWDELHWGQTIEFLAGLLEDPAPLLEMLSEG